ncbi:hypothetical protein [Caproicibacterium sp. BJN0003]|uniref:hypothetical protein n=1 Tax=Caproicibacterium sp. BJN0003 TaxID=2994078 RepID=UPI00225C3774|nr:hypothetical protein [Caproicibacterium sp. BJN0003]UZT82649.1 hypothetical protein OP489_02220 [Caproicibacterium sp. BJN0003]
MLDRTMGKTLKIAYLLIEVDPVMRIQRAIGEGTRWNAGLYSVILRTTITWQHGATSLKMSIKKDGLKVVQKQIHF